METLDHFFVVASQVGTLFLLTAVGYVLARLGKFSRDTQSQLTTLLLYVVSPCLIVDTLQLSPSLHLLEVMGQCLILTLATALLFALLMTLFFRRQPPDARAVLRFGALYGNIGFMGIPLIQGILGDEGLIFAIVEQVAFNLLIWSHGVLLMGDRKTFSTRKLLLNPGLLGCLVGTVLFLLDLRLPQTVGRGVEFLGSMNTPLAMVIIGAQMASANLPATFRDTRLYCTALLKLVAQPLLIAALLLPFGLEPAMYITMVVLAATPTAGLTSMLSQQYGRDTTAAAQLVTLTTLCCMITLPCCAALAGLAVG